MLTGGSVMFMEGSATQVVCGMLMALLAIHVASMCQPFIEDDDDVLALGAQWGVFFTLFGGLLLKLQLNSADGYDKDGSGFGAFLIVVNVLVMRDVGGHWNVLLWCICNRNYQCSGLSLGSHREQIPVQVWSLCCLQGICSRIQNWPNKGIGIIRRQSSHNN